MPNFGFSTLQPHPSIQIPSRRSATWLRTGGKQRQGPAGDFIARMVDRCLSMFAAERATLGPMYDEGAYQLLMISSITQNLQWLCCLSASTHCNRRSKQFYE